MNTTANFFRKGEKRMGITAYLPVYWLIALVVFLVIEAATLGLATYGSDPFVRKNLTIRNCLHYGVQIKSVFWKLLSFTLVLFLRIHAYGFLSAILVFMSRL